MNNNKKITTLAEDFQKLGLIKGPKVDTKKSPVTESVDPDKRKLREERRAKIMARRKKMAEALKQKKAKVEAIRKARAAKLEGKKPARKVKAESTSDALKRLSELENKLRTSTPLSDIMKAFENVSKVSGMALRKFKHLSEQDADKEGGRDAADRDDQKSAYNTTGSETGGPDVKDIEKEGDVGYDSEDEQEAKGGEPGEVDTVTGKYAGKDQTASAEKVDIAEEDELDDLDGLGDDDLDLGDDDLDTSLDDLDSVDSEMGDLDLDLGGDLDMDDVPADDVSLDDCPTDMDVDAELGDMDLGDDGMDDVGMDDLDLELSDDEVDLGDLDGDEEELPQGVESKRIPKSTYISELKDIKKEAEDIMNKIRKHAVSPQDAESLLKDVVMRLGGAVGDLGAMMSDAGKYAASDKTSEM